MRRTIALLGLSLGLAACDGELPPPVTPPQPVVTAAPTRTTVAALCVDGCAGAPLDTRDLGVFFVAGLTVAR